jgi:hypothetical protein
MIISPAVLMNEGAVAVAFGAVCLICATATAGTWYCIASAAAVLITCCTSLDAVSASADGGVLLCAGIATDGVQAGAAAALF